MNKGLKFVLVTLGILVLLGGGFCGGWFVRGFLSEKSGYVGKNYSYSEIKEEWEAGTTASDKQALQEKLGIARTSLMQVYQGMVIQFEASEKGKMKISKMDGGGTFETRTIAWKQVGDKISVSVYTGDDGTHSDFTFHIFEDGLRFDALSVISGYEQYPKLAHLWVVFIQSAAGIENV